MASSNSSQRTKGKAIRSLFKWVLRFMSLYVLFLTFFMLGSLAVAGVMPDLATSEPGLVSATNGLLVVALADLFVIAALILTSRWHGWKLAIGLALAYYGAVTFVMQMETWYFLSSLTVSPHLLPRLFLMGVPTALPFIPLAVWILGRGRATADGPSGRTLAMSVRQWIWKGAVIVVLYLVLYWSAGYFIAWQNPALRAFYGQPGPALPFLRHTANTLHRDPWLFPFQIARALLWVLCALPVIAGSRVKPVWTALLVGALFSVPQNIGHILANPLLPIASVRLSHMVETVLSSFLFGALVVWLLHREHDCLGDLFSIRKEQKEAG
jgi:hypothetical protein